MNGDQPRRFDPPRLLAGAGALALAVMLIGTVADITARLLLNRPLHGTLDLVEVTLVLVAFLALPECFRRDEQIKVDLFDAAVGPRGLALMRVLGEAATLAFLVLLATTLVQPLADAYRFGDEKPDLPVPIFTLLLAIEVALVVSILIVALRLFAQARSFPRRAPSTTPSKTPAGNAGQKAVRWER